MTVKSQKEGKGVEVAQYSGANHSPLHCATCESKTGEGNEEDMMIILPHIYMALQNYISRKKDKNRNIRRKKYTRTGRQQKHILVSVPLCDS